MTYFDKTIAVSPRGEGRYGVELDGGWRVGAAVNGGYLMSIIGNALRAEFPAKPDTVLLNTHFVAASQEGPAEVRLRVVREGGRFATVAAEVVQDGRTMITALATQGDLTRDADDVRTTATPFAIPPREACVSNAHAPEELRKVATLMERFEMLFHPDRIGWALGEPDGSGELSAWVRLKDEREPDPVALLFMCDALPPVTFTFGQMGWAPTLELTTHVRARPAPGWLRLRQVTRNVAGGLFEEDCEIWDSADRLVAQARQLAVLPRG